jgi:hypothetical protein
MLIPLSCLLLLLLLLDALTALPQDVQARIAREAVLRAAQRQQVQRLLELKAAVGQNSSKGCMDRWVVDSSPCAWPGWGGVECNQDGLVTSLGLVECDLQGTLPASLGSLPGLAALQTLSLVYNGGLQGSLSPEWGTGPGLTNLRQLDLEHTGLSGSLPPEWGTGQALGRLRMLVLDNTGLTGPLPTEWCSGAGLASLETLRLENLPALNSTVPLECVHGPGLAQLKELQLTYGAPQAAGAGAGLESVPLLPELGRLRSLRRLYVRLWAEDSVKVTLPPDWAANDTGLT